MPGDNVGVQKQVQGLQNDHNHLFFHADVSPQSLQKWNLRRASLPEE